MAARIPAPPAPTIETAPSAAKADAVVTAAEIYGVLGVWDGKLALFCGEETPAAVYDVWVETLPEEEKSFEDYFRNFVLPYCSLRSDLEEQEDEKCC